MKNECHTPVHLAAGEPAAADDFIIIRRYRLVNRLIPLRGRVLLDFGCGNGAQAFLFAADFPLVVGVDISRRHLGDMRGEAMRRGLSERALPVLYDGVRLPLQAASVDCAISFEVLEHVENEEQVLSELARVIRPGGSLAVSVPNRWWIFETHGAELPLLPWNRVPFFGWLPKRIHDRYARARNYTRSEFAGKLAAAGFDVKRAVYVTAPMDVIGWRPLRRALRATIFKSDSTAIPLLSTAVLAVATRNIR